MSQKTPDQTPPQKRLPDLIIQDENLPATARELAKRFAAAGSFFRRGGEIVKVVTRSESCEIVRLSVHGVVDAAHDICRPVVECQSNGEVFSCPKTLPDRVARLPLSSLHEIELPRLDGLCSAPVLGSDGSIRTASGYDPDTRYWCAGIEIPPLPERPSRDEAAQALLALRDAFASFPFADGVMKSHGNASTIDIAMPPGLDESALIATILTAVCRPSLGLAPALLIRAPQFSGAGTGKGLLVRAAALIAYDVAPSAFSSGGDRTELDKRVAAALLQATPVVFLDNVNATTIRSDLVAQIVTESECETRPLGVTRMVRLAAKTFVAVTGNGVRVGEDLARRFLVVNLDARCGNAEQRRFDDERFLETIKTRRLELLAAALTIWRWGRQNDVPRGRAFGSFEQWAAWVRDPLLALACCDPVERIDEIKQDDPHRRQFAEFLAAWHQVHGDRPVTIRQLDDSVWAMAGLNGRNR